MHAHSSLIKILDSRQILKPLKILDLQTQVKNLLTYARQTNILSRRGKLGLWMVTLKREGAGTPSQIVL